jgi:hypothetical protein
MEDGLFSRTSGGKEEKEKEQVAGEPSEYCPVCWTPLESHKCKLVCRRCGYYMSCSDYY